MIADTSCRLLEVDFSGIEAVLTGYIQWRLGVTDAQTAYNYIRLARLGMHAGVTSIAVGKPADFSWPDDQLGHYLKEIKHAYPKEYDIAKRTVHANNFGMTPYGMVEKFPEFFPTLAKAQEFQSYYYVLAPGLQPLHRALRHRAREVGYLGGPTLPGATPSIWDHPYGYRHWFWDVLAYKPCTEWTARKWLADPARADRILKLHGRWFKVDFGSDGNRCIAFYPQSIAAGRLKEAQRALFLPWSESYIGDAYFGRTPLLGPIHDSLVLHIPNACWDKVVGIVAQVMQAPSQYLPCPEEWGLGPFLPIGVSAKAGHNWAPKVTAEEAAEVGGTPNGSGMEEIEIPKWVPTAGPDDPVLPREGEGEMEDWEMLRRQVA